MRPFTWVPNSKIKDGKAYVLETKATYDSETENYLVEGEDGQMVPLQDVLVDSKGHVYSYDLEAVIVELADGSGQAVYKHDVTATVDENNNVLTD